MPWAGKEQHFNAYANCSQPVVNQINRILASTKAVPYVGGGAITPKICMMIGVIGNNPEAYSDFGLDIVLVDGAELTCADGSAPADASGSMNSYVKIKTIKRTTVTLSRFLATPLLLRIDASRAHGAVSDDKAG